MNTKQLSRTTTALILAVLLCSCLLHAEEPPATQAAVPQLSGQHPRTQRAFKKHAKNWVRIGEVLWSIEVKNFSKRKLKGSAKARAPYEADNAPFYYDPITGKAFKQAPVAPKKTSRSRNTSPKIHGGFYVDPGRKPKAKETIEKKAVPEGEPALQPATAQELFAYFLEHDLQSFPILRPKMKVIKMDVHVKKRGYKMMNVLTFDWNNYPEKVRFTK